MDCPLKDECKSYGKGWDAALDEVMNCINANFISIGTAGCQKCRSYESKEETK